MHIREKRHRLLLPTEFYMLLVHDLGHLWTQFSDEDAQTYLKGKGLGGWQTNLHHSAGASAKFVFNIDAVGAHSCIDASTDKEFLSRTQLLIINQLQNVLTRRSLSTAYRIRSEVRDGSSHVTHSLAILYTVDKVLQVKTSCS